MKSYAAITLLVAFGSLAAVPTQAEIIVLGDFEGPGSDQLDGWSVMGGNSGIAGNDVGAIWSSTGSGAMAIFFESDNGFQWTLQYSDLDALANLANPGGARIVADVYWRTSDWDGTEGWARWDTASFNSNLGWMQTSNTMMGDSANPAFPGSWDPSNWGDSHERTIWWDFSTLLAGATPDEIINGGWAQLYLSLNGDTGPGTHGTFYIDNIRLETIPEPATMLLLGLGGVLLRKRRI